MTSDFDLLVGITARRYGLTLLTNNRRHFENVEGLRIESLS
jgi:predicted nucleic acid-binding protein